MITTRKATTADISLINELATEAFPYTYREILTPEQIDYMMDWMYSPESLRRQMEEEGAITITLYIRTDRQPATSLSSRKATTCFTCKRFMYSPLSGRTDWDEDFLKWPLMPSGIFTHPLPHGTECQPP